MRLLASTAPALTLIALCLAPAPAGAECDTQGLAQGTEVVELALTGGTVCLEMLRADAGINVDNFLYYVLRGDYDGSLFHRLIPGFVLQGGDQRRDGMGDFEFIEKRDVDPQDGVPDPVLNQPCTKDTPGMNPPNLICSERGNERGTVAGAKIMNMPDSFSTNFFINLEDNRDDLDYQNDGFTVFARVMGDGMDYVDTLIPPTAYQRQAITGPVAGFAQAALMGPQGVGSYQGCFDPNGNVSAVVRPESLPSLIGKPDPRSGQIPFLLSTACSATLVEDETKFVANPCAGQITSVDELAVGFDPATQFITPFPPVYYAHSCSAVDQFLAAIDAARLDASYQAAYEAEVVYIESASLIVVPEAAEAAMLLGACATLLELRRRRTQPGA